MRSSPSRKTTERRSAIHPSVVARWPPLDVSSNHQSQKFDFGVGETLSVQVETSTLLPSRGHFCLDLHVAMQFRPYHHPLQSNGALVVVVGVGGSSPPNLLIVRTGRIVTFQGTTQKVGDDMD